MKSGLPCAHTRGLPDIVLMPRACWDDHQMRSELGKYTDSRCFDAETDCRDKVLQMSVEVVEGLQ